LASRKRGGSGLQVVLVGRDVENRHRRRRRLTAQIERQVSRNRCLRRPQPRYSIMCNRQKTMHA